jgi:beta-lactam-binding protein with PASTA domain
MGVKVDTQVTITKMSTDDTPDTILQQIPGPDQEFEPDKVAIKFSVSQRDTIKMPDLRNLTLDQARDKINTNKLKLNEANIQEAISYKVAKGKVLKQFPYNFNDDVSVGSEINLVMSSGMPAEAGVLTVSVPLQPSEAGKESTFKIFITDAQYETPVEYKTVKTAVPLNVDVKVTLGPDKQAVIQVKENDKVVGPDIIRTYQDYVNSGNAKPANAEAPTKEAQ